MAKHLSSIHFEILAARFDVLRGHPGVIHRPGRVYPELLRVRPFRVQIEAQDASVAVLGRTQHHRAGTIGEDHRDMAPGAGDLQPGGLNLRAHDQHSPILAGLIQASATDSA